MALCTVDQCGRPYLARGFCSVHYQQDRRAGGGGRDCAVTGCSGGDYAKGYCSKHYQRHRKYGDAEHVECIQGDDEARFWANVDKTDTCWLWRGAPDAYGYGRMRVNGKQVKAHRFAYELLAGPIPAGLTIDHLCRVRHCVNPEHLEPVTNAENARRARSAEA